MKVYLAGFKTIEKVWGKPTEDIYLLSSFYEHKTGRYGDYVFQEKHILDSGAFSFFGGGQSVDWKKYVGQYCDFIKKTNQKLFFELDIDLITSLKFAEQLRKEIEFQTGRQSIPVWRPSRGLEYWHKMIEEYSYVAISASGAFDSAWTRTNEGLRIMQKLLALAHAKNCKVHGLGYTFISTLKQVPFDSIDSTTWNVGGKYGNVCLFDKNWNSARQRRPKNMRVKDVKNLHLYNFENWVKFQKYAEQNL